jgi:uncharacterized protein (TIGR02680 family)
VNLWEYDNAEFWFADGRLVLRGGNGAGKTKVLELTTLMLLRGEVGASVLDPFGSQHRTMRFNLLPTGEGDDPRPLVDSGLGYAWVEFGRRDDTGAARYFSCGMGVSARRGAGSGAVTTWHFLSELRPGAGIELMMAGRPIDQKDLKKIEGVTVPGSAAAYRARLAAELFDLPTESYDNLTELLKQLRRPKLGERLNPARLAETLTEALPPLATHEVTQLADGWEHLEQLRTAVEQTEQSAVAVARFVRTGWRPWARAVVRERADAMAKATTDLDNTTRDKRAAEASLGQAREQSRTAERELAATSEEKIDRDTELRELLESTAYTDAVGAAGRVETLRDAVKGLDTQHRAADRRLETARISLGRIQEHAAAQRGLAADAEGEVHDASTVLREAARPAGLVNSVESHLPTRDLDALAADHTARQERFGHLRTLAAEHDAAKGRVELSALALRRSKADLSRAREDESTARVMVRTHAAELGQAIRDWASAATVTPCSDELLEGWVDRIGELTVIDAESGTVRASESVTELMRTHVARSREPLVERAGVLRLDRAPLAVRRRELDDELAEARSGIDASPPVPVSWGRRNRPDLSMGLGAPLWRLVNPVGHIDHVVLARVEAALGASGLLDAWVTPEGILSTVDGMLLADVQPGYAPPRPGATLLTVLEPDTAGGVPHDIVRRLLAGIGWYDARPTGVDGDWLAADGSWRTGGLVGRADPVGPVSYLGAAARAAARQRRIAALTAELDSVTERLVAIDDDLADIDDATRTLDDEERLIPRAAERALVTMVATLAERVRRLTDRESAVREDAERHAEEQAGRDDAWASFAEYAGEHRFGLRDLPAQEQALHEFGTRLQTLVGRVRLLNVRLATAETAESDVSRHDEAYQTAEGELRQIEGELRRAQVRLRTAEEALTVEHAQLLRRRQELDDKVTELEKAKEKLNRRLADTRVAVSTAESTLAQHEERRATAETMRDMCMAALWGVADAGLVEPLAIPLPERRTVQTARELTAAIRRMVTLGPQASDTDRAWRRCFEQLEQLRQELLPNRDARVDDESFAIPLVLVLTDPASGWQPPHQAADTLAQRVTEQQAGYDAEQQRVLATLLGSTFIEHLKDRLDYTTHTFTRINERLARHPTRHGHVVRVLHEPDPTDPDAGAVVRALTRGYDELSAERQEMVRSFLARKIDEARADAAADGLADWKDQLYRALDYRHWLRVSLQYRLGGAGAWAVFDAAKHGAKSGGEKVVLLSQPLFAAAVVAYDAAGPYAPRWVWLDEAMTGVDAEVKASFMGLTVDFELDIMLTAHDEWCTYPSVPAVAVYDLARQPHLPGVDAMPYLWCGGALTAVEPGVAAPPDPLPDDGLFGLLDSGSADD